MEDKKSEEKSKPEVKGIGGWLILPIIGMFITIGMQLVDLYDTVMFYEIAEMQLYIFSNIFFIVLAGLCLYNIFKKNKIARTFGIIFYGASLLANILLIGEFSSYILGSFIWMMYFIRSKRVKNTLID